MKHFVCISIILTLLVLHSSGRPVAQRTNSNAKYLRPTHAARQLAAAPYPAAGQRPVVPFVLPTEEQTVLLTMKREEEAATKLEEKDENEAAGDLAEDEDPFAADAAEDDTNEPLPQPESQFNAKSVVAVAKEEE